MEQLRMNSDLSVATPSIFEDLESYGDVLYDTNTDAYPLPRNPIIEDTILDGKHCDVYLITKENSDTPDIFIHIGTEATPEELRRAEAKRESFHPLSTDNHQPDKNQIDAEKEES
jgi:hypothetical protein